MENRRYWGKTIASFFLVLCTMPLGHALMKVMESTLSISALHYSAFAMGLAGLAMVITKDGMSRGLLKQKEIQILR